jgi:peroxiredoxin
VSGTCGQVPPGPISSGDDSARNSSGRASIEQTGPGTREKPRPKGDRIWMALTAVAALCLVGFIVYIATRPHHLKTVAYPVTAPAALAVGSTAPPFELPRLGGGAPVSLASTQGTPTVVNFFASWCRDCQAELTDFAALSSATGGHVAIIGVDSNDSDGAQARTLLAAAKATYPVGVDTGAKVATSYLLAALPVTYFLDANSRVVHVAFGTQTLATLTHWAHVLTTGTGNP